MLQILKYVGCAVLGVGTTLIGGAIKRKRVAKKSAKKTVKKDK